MYNESTTYENYESIMYTLTVLIQLTSIFGRLGRRALRGAGGGDGEEQHRGARARPPRACGDCGCVASSNGRAARIALKS